MRYIFYIIVIVSVTAFALFGTYYALALKSSPENIEYGVSFNTLYARELDLDWKETYDAILEDLNVKHLRLAAHWPMIEPQNNEYNFTELDYQIAQARTHGADVILGVGRRLPRWPECHVPGWAQELSRDEQQREIREYIETVVKRYRHDSTVILWQVENEPFLEIFAHEHCGDLDVEFLDEEIALVKSLDSSRPILLTDSGNLGTWIGAYRRGDVFGTSAYVYLWNPDIGPFKSFLPPSFYRAKEGVMNVLFGVKETILIELAAEPWLLQPIIGTPLETQLQRMNPEKFESIISFGRKTRFQKQYLWGAEWWYWLRERDQSAMWERAKVLFRE